MKLKKKQVKKEEILLKNYLKMYDKIMKRHTHKSREMAFRWTSLSPFNAPAEHILHFERERESLNRENLSDFTSIVSSMFEF